LIAISLQEEDKLILEKLNKVLNSNRVLKFNKARKKTWKNTYLLQIYSKHMSQQLSKLGCFQAKSLTLKFPTEEQVPNNLLFIFLRGLWDGDGCIYIDKSNKYKLSLVSTLNVCMYIKNLINLKFGINSYLYRTKSSIKRNTSTRTLSISGNIQVRKFLNLLYKDATIYLERKFNKYQIIKWN
jgi:intein/homing endonuclease